MDMRYVFGELGKPSERFSNKYLIYRIITRQTPEKSNLHFHCRENFKFVKKEWGW
jgi:hypothetical protein